MLEVLENEAIAIDGDGRTFIAKLAAGEYKNIRFTKIELIADSTTNDSMPDIGSACSSRIEVSMPADKSISADVELQLLMMIKDGSWHSLGYYTPQKPSTKDGTTTFIAYDRMASRCSGDYISKLTFPCDIYDVCVEIEEQTGINIKNKPKGIQISQITDDDGVQVSYDNPFKGCTHREAIGYIAGAIGKFAIFNYDGDLEFRWYTSVDYSIKTHMSYGDIDVAEDIFAVDYLSCTIADDITIESGEGDTGISFSNPIVNQTIVDNLFKGMKGFSFYPTTLSFKGDFRLELGDTVTIYMLDGTTYEVPIMHIKHTFDGGLATQIASYGSTGQSAATYKSPLMRELQRFRVSLSDVDKGLAAKIEATEESIITEVNKSYTTKEEFNNLEIGGRNLFLNSSFSQGTSFWGGANKSTISVSSIDNKTAIFLDTSTATLAIGACFQLVRDVELSTKYTASAMIYLEEACVVQVRAWYDSNGWRGISAKNVNGNVGWNYVSHTFTSNEIVNNLVVSFQCNKPYTLYVYHPKLEKGNKPTDWTPAPEDVEEDATIKANSALASANQNTANQLKNYSTTSQMNSAIEQSSENIKIAVSEEYTTKVEFRNLEIGGRNLLIGSANHNFAKNFLGVAEYKGTVNFINDASVPSKKIFSVTCTNAGRGFYSLAGGDVTGTTYTYSFYAKCSVNKSGTIGYEKGGRFHIDLTTDWRYYKHTFTADDNSYCAFTWYLGWEVGEILYIHSFKIEIGNKATDWTPAPEDLETDATNKANAAKEAAIADTTNKLKSYSTTTQMNSAINASKEAITSEVSKTYTTKEEFNNLEIGGRNLIAGTSLNKVYQGTAPEGSLVDVFTAQTINPLTEKEYIVSFDAKADIPNWSIMCFFYSPNTTTSGKSSTGQTSTNADGNTLVTISNEWKRYWVKWTQSETTTVKKLIVGRSLSSKVNVYIKAVKLEQGNKATDWTPAPEDTEEQISTVYTKAEQTAEDFSWLVADDYSESNVKLSKNAYDVIAENITLRGNHIQLDGDTTIGEGFTLKADNIEAGTLSADITATNFKMQGGSIKIHTTSNDYSVIDLRNGTDGLGIRPSSLMINSDIGETNIYGGTMEIGQSYVDEHFDIIFDAVFSVTPDHIEALKGNSRFNAIVTGERTGATDTGNPGAFIGNYGAMHLSRTDGNNPYYALYKNGNGGSISYDGTNIIFSKPITAPNINIGKYKSENSSSTNISSSTSCTNKQSLSLEAGVWLVQFWATWEGNSSGRRHINISNTSGSSSSNGSVADIRYSGGTGSFPQSKITILNVSSTTTFYINAGQNSGSTLSCTTGYRAVRII